MYSHEFSEFKRRIHFWLKGIVSARRWTTLLTKIMGTFQNEYKMRYKEMILSYWTKISENVTSFAFLMFKSNASLFYHIYFEIFPNFCEQHISKGIRYI